MTIVSKRFSEQLEKDYGISWERMKPFFEGPYHACKTGKADLKEELGKVIGDWGWKGSVEELVKLWFTSGSEADSRMIELIHALRQRGVRCYLTTNNEKYRANFLRDEMKFDELFDGMFSSAEVGYLKSDAKFFEHVYQELAAIDPALPREEILFTDDRQENISTAKTFGFQTYLYHGFEAFEEYLSTLTI